MKITVLAIVLVLEACSSGPQSDLPTIKNMRSAAAEWALVNREAARGRLTEAYVMGMRKAARDEIATEAEALSPQNAPAGRHAGALQALPADAAPAAIEAHVAALKQIETALESA